MKYRDDITRAIGKSNCTILGFVFLAGLIAVLASACTSVPRPFKDVEKNEHILTSITVNPGVIISSVSGLPEPYGQELAADVAVATRENDVAATTEDAGNSSSRLVGKADIVEEANEKKSFQIVWKLTAPNGLGTDILVTSTPPAKISGKMTDPALELITKTDFSQTIRDVADYLEVALFRPSAISIPAAMSEDSHASPSSPAAYKVAITRLEGAPGNGNLLMKEALKIIFSDKNLSVPVKLVNAPTQDTFIISARTRKTQGLEGFDKVSITWTVASADGEVIGTVSQNNEVAAGSLDGDWGEIAFYAAEAAAEGILNIMLQFEP